MDSSTLRQQFLPRYRGESNVRLSRYRPDQWITGFILGKTAALGKFVACAAGARGRRHRVEVSIKRGRPSHRHHSQATSSRAHTALARYPLSLTLSLTRVRATAARAPRHDRHQQDEQCLPPVRAQPPRPWRATIRSQ